MLPLISTIKQCTICAQHLPLGANPVLQASEQAKIAIIGQAPGIRVHESGIPWNDPSGKNLRSWMGVTDDEFYNPELCAIIPMGFCYPGTGKSGDLPPRPECALEWHQKLFQQLPNIQLTLLIGKYAQDFYLKDQKRKTLTETVKHYQEYLPNYFVLPHPSPRNNIWQKKNPWFKDLVINELTSIISKTLGN